MPKSKPYLCPVLIGRTFQVEAASRLLGRAMKKEGQTLIISGEAGIGKSRLVAEIATRAESQSFLVLRVQCYENDSALPYAPISDLLRTLITRYRGDRDAQDIGPDVAEF